MNKMLLIFVAALAGCSSLQPAVVTVDVPVNTPCVIQKIEPPEFAVDTLPIGSGIWEQMNALRAERLQRQGYESVLNAAIGACQK